ncbi:hypothetical protein H0H92_015059 [Tricholoma furcatifolium]|nr:hypothetical protein H0H92_015059 [Tricholoma furcatifolium]
MPLSSASSTPFQTLALNANGLGDVMKTSAIEQMVQNSSPHALVIEETKSTNRGSSTVSLAYMHLGTPEKTLANSDHPLLTSARHRRTPAHGISPQEAYRTFLSNTYAIDLWSLIPDHHYETHYTFSTLAADNDSEPTFRAHAIIDRVPTSRVGIISGDIATLDFFVPCTDHHPIVSNIVLMPPGHGHADISSEIPPSSYAPRFLHPRKTEDHLFETFSSALDDRISQNPVLAQTDVVDHVTFDIVYGQMSTTIQQSAANAFRKPKPPSSRTQKPSNSTIRLILVERHRVNCLIAAIKAFTTRDIDHFPSDP